VLGGSALAAEDSVAGREFVVVGQEVTKRSYLSRQRGPEQVAIQFHVDEFEIAEEQGLYQQRGRRIRLVLESTALQARAAAWAADFRTHLEAQGAEVESVSCRAKRSRLKAKSKSGRLRLKTKDKFRCEATGDFGTRRAKIKVRFKGRGSAGSIADFDDDGDGLVNALEVQLNTDSLQADSDGDGVDDGIEVSSGTDPNSATSFPDADADQIADSVDTCPAVANPTQTDTDANGTGDACNDSEDSDADEWADALDNCRDVPNSDQADQDADGQGDLCDACPSDASGDSDGDGSCDSVDLCSGNDASGDTDGNGLCDDIDLSIQFPEAGLLLLTGSQALSIVKPEGAIQGSLVVRLDGQDITSSLDELPDGVSQDVPIDTVGEHALVVSVDLAGGGSSTASVSFESVALENPEACETLNNVHCLYPYPSNRFLGFNAEKGRGQLEFPDSALAFPGLAGTPPTAAQFRALDGFSPTVTIQAHFPGGVDLVGSGVARLLSPDLSSPMAPPYVGIRMTNERSLEPGSPTVLLNAETGERVLHWAELDARASGNPDRQAFILRPGVSLVPGDRYIVAIRDLQHPGGTPVEAEAVFAALRDGRDSSIPGYVEKQQHFEQEIFPVLEAAGIDRSGLVLAWDFQTQTDHGLTHHALDMRDMSFAWLSQQVAAGQQTFTVDSIEAVPGECDDGEGTWRIVRGTYQVPLFLSEDPELDILSVGFLNEDANEDPVQNGVTNPPYTISIPCASLDPAAPVVHPVVLGHGLFGVGDSMVTGLVSGLGLDIDVLAGATNWRGLSSADLNYVIFQVVGTGATGNQFEQFPAFPDRLKQGQINTVLLARMMKNGVFNMDPAFQTESGAGVFPGPTVEMFYYGISLGGIMGTMFAALTPDVERLNVDVPAMNFAMLLQRSTQFGQFELLLTGIGLTDPLYTLLTLSLNHEMWVRSEPAGYVRHITSDPLPGTNAKKILLTMAWLDKQVSNQATEILARSLGIPNLSSSVQQGFPGIPDVAGPVDSAMVVYDTGSYDIFDVRYYVPQNGQALIPPLANLIPSPRCDPHAARLTIPASLDQLATFLQPGGQITNSCEGLCDATIPYERPNGSDTSCNPLD
jgi:hypothetical protein